LTVIGPPYHPHVDAARRRACATDETASSDPAVGSPGGDAIGRRGCCALVARRAKSCRRLPTLLTVRIDVTADVTPIRHDATAGQSAGGVSVM